MIAARHALTRLFAPIPPVADEQDQRRDGDRRDRDLAGERQGSDDEDGLQERLPGCPTATSVYRRSAADDQARIAVAYIDQLDSAHVFAAPIVTTIEMGRTFYPAEDYHQDYLTLHPDQPYIAINDLPKVADLDRLFPDYWRAEPVQVMAKDAGKVEQ